MGKAFSDLRCLLSLAKGEQKMITSVMLVNLSPVQAGEQNVLKASERLCRNSSAQWCPVSAGLARAHVPLL